MNKPPMTSNRPYLLRAFYEWITDNKCTPYLLVDTHLNGVLVPQQHVNEDGQIVLNVSETAVMGLTMDNYAIRFNARFGGVPTDIQVPVGAVVGIYARENGQGMVFEPEETPEPPEPTPPTTLKKPSKKPSLRVVK